MTCIVPLQTKYRISQSIVVPFACNTVPPAPRKLRQEGHNNKTSLCHIGRSCLKNIKIKQKKKIFHSSGLSHKYRRKFQLIFYKSYVVL